MASISAGEGFINHYGFVRLRVTGSGNLKMRLLSLSETKTKTLTPLTMTSSTDKEITKKCNFTQQRAQLEIKTTEIDETFVISRIIVFIKPVAEAYPG